MEQSTAVHTKVPVVVRDDYTMYLEFFNSLLWFHTDVRKWSSKVKLKFVEDLNLLHYLTGIPIVALVDENDKKLAKFGEVTGWSKAGVIPLKTNKVGYIYKWSK